MNTRLLTAIITLALLSSNVMADTRYADRGFEIERDYRSQQQQNKQQPQRQQQRAPSNMDNNDYRQYDNHRQPNYNKRDVRPVPILPPPPPPPVKHLADLHHQISKLLILRNQLESARNYSRMKTIDRDIQRLRREANDYQDYGSSRDNYRY